MPPIFKALITISVWVLFITGWLATITTGIVIGSAMLAGKTMPMEAVANGSAGLVAFIFACLAAWIRKKVE